MDSCGVIPWVFCLALVLALPTTSIYAQRSDDERRSDRENDRERDRRRDNERDRRSNDDDEQRERYREERRREFMRQLDRNGDGTVERSEVESDRWWGYFERAAKDAGLDPSKPIAIEQYMNARRNQERARWRAENPTAFLPGPDATKAPGFDVPLSQTELVMLNPNRERPYVLVEKSPATLPEQASPKNTPGSSSSVNQDINEKTRKYVAELIEKYDKDDNSILERDEWKSMGNEPERSDFNNDGRITRDELIKRFSSFKSDEGDEGDRKVSASDDREERRRRRSRDDEDRDEDKHDVRKTYRFTPALERLPSDARSWVDRYDDNDDGQVAMAEFASAWTDSKVREFAKYDLDDDGLVTGAEYLKSKER